MLALSDGAPEATLDWLAMPERAAPSPIKPTHLANSITPLSALRKLSANFT